MWRAGRTLAASSPLAVEQSLLLRRSSAGRRFNSVPDRPQHLLLNDERSQFRHRGRHHGGGSDIKLGAPSTCQPCPPLSAGYTARHQLVDPSSNTLTIERSSSTDCHHQGTDAARPIQCVPVRYCWPEASPPGNPRTPGEPPSERSCGPSTAHPTSSGLRR